jgi:hypothetical protein
MRRSILVRWIALGIGLGLCPLLAGCFGAAWPSVALTPTLLANADADQVRAFRVDVMDTHATVEFHESSVYTLREVPVLAGGWVVPQGKASCDYGWWFGNPALTYWKLKRHTLMVRLYRPGCQTVEVPAWTLPQNVHWSGARDLAGQEKAIDDLVSIGTPDSFEESEEGKRLIFRRLAAGSESEEHRQALLFAAAEYQRVAKTAPDDSASKAIRERMEQKAATLRQLAEK